MERLQPPLPEGLLRSRHAGWIYADQLPWLDRDHDEEVGMSLLTFPEGDVLIAAAGTPTMNRISETTREKTPWKNVDYTQDDSLWLRAVRRKAIGIGIKDSSLSREYNPLPAYEGFTIEGLRTKNGPNAHRVYFASTTIGRLESHSTIPQAIDPGTLLIIRLVVTDKKNQIRALQQLTGEGRRAMRGAGNVGSI